MNLINRAVRIALGLRTVPQVLELVSLSVVYFITPIIPPTATIDTVLYLQMSAFRTASDLASDSSQVSRVRGWPSNVQVASNYRDNTCSVFTPPGLELPLMSSHKYVKIYSSDTTEVSTKPSVSFHRERIERPVFPANPPSSPASSILIEGNSSAEEQTHGAGD